MKMNYERTEFYIIRFDGDDIITSSEFDCPENNTETEPMPIGGSN